MAAPLELVHKLIALATNNPNEEEAKLAALKAVRLIKEHKLLPGAPEVRKRPIASPSKSEPEFYKAHKAQEDFFGQAANRKDRYGDPLYDDSDIYNYFYGGNRGGGKTKTQQQQQQTPGKPPAGRDHDFDVVTEQCRKCSITIRDYLVTGMWCQ